MVRLLRCNEISGLWAGGRPDPIWAVEVVDGPELKPSWLRETALAGWEEHVPLEVPTVGRAFRVDLRTVSAPNAREHPHAKARRVKGERARVAIALRAFKRLGGAGPLVSQLRAGGQVILTRRGPGDLDDDNLAASLKGVRDEIAAWLGVDDGDRRIRYIPRQQPGNAYAVDVHLIPHAAVVTPRSPEDLMATKPKPKLIMLTQADCSFCTAAKPLFAALQAKHSGTFDFETIDFVRRRQEYDMEILAAPTFRLENPGTGKSSCSFMVNPTQMEDGLTEEAVLEWATSHLGACPVKRPAKKGPKSAGKRAK